MASGIPKYGTWENGGSHGFTVEFAKVRKFKHGRPIMTENGLNQDMLPRAKSEPPMPEAANVKTHSSEARKAHEGFPPKANPQGEKLDELSVKKSTLHPRTEAIVRSGKHQSKTPEDRGPNASPHVPEFGVWDKSVNFTDIFTRNQKGGAYVFDNPDPPRPTKKGGCWKWLCGCFSNKSC